MGFWRKEQITFFLTSQCNLSCTYCYMPKMHIADDDRYIDLDFARVGLIDFFNQSSSRTIRFFASGEPTVAFERMVAIWKMAYALAGSDLRVELETNGYFNSSIADWVEKHVDYLWISCDGPADIQDSQRPSVNFDNSKSSTIVHENIKRFTKHSTMQFGVRATISEDNLARQSELIEAFCEMGVKYVAASPTYYSKVNPQVKTPSLLEFAKGFVPAYYRAIELGMFYQTLMIVNFDEEVDYYCQSSIPTPRITTDGYVSSCDWASYGPKYLPDDAQQELVIGRYDKKTGSIRYDTKKIQGIKLRNVDYLAKNCCAGCRAIRHCAGGCVGKMAAATDSIYDASREWCEAVLYLFDRLPVNQGLYPFLHP